MFWYLTGVESPDCTLVMDAKSGDEILFLPPKNRMGEAWEGEKWDADDAWVPKLTGIRDVRSTEDLDSALKKLCKKGKTVWISKHPHVALMGGFDRAGPFDRRQKRDFLDGRPSREDALEARLEELYDVEVKNFGPHLDRLRQVKTQEELEAMRRASRAGALAMAEAMRSTRPGAGEWEIEALMTWFQIRNGATGPGYHGIVGGGPNSRVLHYSASSRAMQDGEVLLIDYAPEVDHYVSDITRTWPVGGKFTKRQAELYDVVLEAQLAGIAAVRPRRHHPRRRGGGPQGHRQARAHEAGHARHLPLDRHGGARRRAHVRRARARHVLHRRAGPVRGEDRHRHPHRGRGRRDRGRLRGPQLGTSRRSARRSSGSWGATGVLDWLDENEETRSH